ncbi:MAG: glycosyltransferase family 4 protein, partial [Ignavibacterium sp.]|nr:glycosyltransferase family 4 protein [Ignavibacterium sp.]
RYFDAYLFVSQFTKSKFLEFYPDVSDRAHVIYNFSSDFDSSINRGDYFLYIGRLDREKGLPTLLEAFREMKDIKLVIAGSGPLKELINQYNINDNIVYVGYKRGEELSLLIKNSEYVIVPSECYENLPMSVVESFSYSKPVISSKLGGLKELVENSSAGFLFEPKNVNDLMRVVRIAKSISDDEYKILSNNAYQFAINNFNSENFYAKLLAIYKKLITSK